MSQGVGAARPRLRLRMGGNFIFPAGLSHRIFMHKDLVPAWIKLECGERFPGKAGLIREWLQDAFSMKCALVLLHG
jgi:hypothetical protein